MIDLLFLTYDDPRIPSRRFRVEAFLPKLRSAGLSVEVVGLPDAFLPRMIKWARLPRAKTMVIQKKLFRPLELRLIRARCERLIYDFDDAVYLSGKGRARFGPQMSQCDMIFAGNAVLAREAAVSGKPVEIIPTAVDVRRFTPRQGNRSPVPVIGWTGTRYNLQNLELVAGPFADLRKKQAFGLRYICDRTSETLSARGWEHVAWSAETEARDVEGFDIGLMPLPDTEYNRGKCGFKILQYMAAGVPPVASPVGVNRDIIEHGVNGFLTDSPREWGEAFEALLGDPVRYADISRRARERAMDFSCERVFEKMLPHLRPA